LNSGVVTEYLISLIGKQVNDNGLVVWYDPDRTYAEVAETLVLPDSTVFRYDRSFMQLRWEIDQKKLMDGEEPPRIVVYVPMAEEETHHALIEMEAAGVVMQPGQQPPWRNTRLAILARNVLKDVLDDESAAQVEKQVEAGKLTLADLNALADKGGEISKGVLVLIFGTGNPQEIALSFLDSDRQDESITKKDAKSELMGLLRREYGFDAPNGAKLDDLRRRLARYVLLTDLVFGLADAIPSKIASIPVAPTPGNREACAALAKAWRLRRDTRKSYVASAQQVEQEFDLANVEFNSHAIMQIETFSIIERALLRNAENRLLEKTDGDMFTLAESRLSRFWCDVEPKLQARWALVASATEVLLEADRVEQALKKAPASLTNMIKKYADSDQPWCKLDTYYRHMESRWHNFESYGDELDSIEKLVIKARQRYVEVGSEIARHFVSQIQKEIPNKSFTRQREVFEKHVKPLLGKEKVAYVWVDALRFEMAKELWPLLENDFQVELYPALAAIPTITEIGMAALLPGAHENAKVVAVSAGKLALEVSGKVIRDRKDRVAFLKEYAGIEVFDTKLDNLLPKPSKKIREGIAKAELVLVTSQEIDELCEQDNITQARRQMDGILNDLRRGIRVLFDLNIECIVLASDHGHLFADELSEDMKVESPGGETIDLHRRVWIGRGGKAEDAFMRAPLSALDSQGEFDLATPWTFACFKCKGGTRAYFHGGLSPQELLVPIMILRPSAISLVGPPTGIAWQLVPGSQKLTTRFFSVQVTGVNTGLFETETPKVRVELQAKGKTISRAVSASYGFEEATGDVALRSDVEKPKNIVPNTITLMIIDDLNQKSVGLYLFDAATVAELSRLEKIEVAISI
jgi:hypothetical protein